MVTGGAERVGAYVCRALAAAGAAVVINHLDEAAAAANTQSAILAAGGRAVVAQADISDPAAAHRLVRAAVDEFGSLDLVVHNASTFVNRPFLQITADDLEKSLGAIVKGPLWVSQAAVPAMGARGGRMIAVIGNSVSEAWPGYLTHSIAKAALKRMMENLAIELAPDVSCLTVCPGQLIVGEDPAHDVRARRGEHRGTTHVEMPDGQRMHAGTPQDLADAVVMLAAAPAYLNGTSLVLDGGRSLY